MKTCIATLSLLLALSSAASAGTKQSVTTINGRTVTVLNETTTQAPAECQGAVERQVNQQGWHDHIYRSVEGDKAFMIFTQRDADVCAAKEVKITLWKAVAKDGKTVTETWVYNLKKSEVNDFLDRELRSVAVKFKALPVQSS